MNPTQTDSEPPSSGLAALHLSPLTLTFWEAHPCITSPT